MRCAWAAYVVGFGLAGLGACSKAPPPQQPPPPEVAVSVPLQRNVQDALDYPARTTAIASDEIRPRVTGFLQELLFTPRARVRAGDALFVIDERPFRIALEKAKADLDVAQSQLSSAEFNAHKIERLYPKGEATEQEFVDSQAALAQVRAQIEVAKAAVDQAQLDLDWCRVTSLIDGRISRNLVDVGNIVTADQTVLATLTDDSAIYAYLDVSEHDVLTYRERRRQQLAAGGKVKYENGRGAPAFLGLMTETGFPHAGAIDYVAPALDPNTGTLEVRAKFPNEDGALLPGVFARVRLPIGEPQPALLVTDRALGSEQGQHYLLVVSDKQVVEYRAVEIGALHDGLRAITAGLTPGDRVIVNGLQRVRPGVTVRPNEVPMPRSPTTTSASQLGRVTTQPSAPTTQPAGPNGKDVP